MTERVIGVIQARMGSSRLPGKVLADIGGLPLILWTVAAIRAVPSIDALVVATTQEPPDDRLVAALDGLVPVHRGSTRDVLARCWDAVLPFDPQIVVRATADNPFVDPDVVEAQIARVRDEGFDFVGNAGWPLGTAAEVARATSLGQAAEESRDPAEREHVMPFLYALPQRFRIGTLPGPAAILHGRYTVDTEADLALARALAARLGHGPPVHLSELEAIISAEPALARLNADIRHRDWREANP
jgi:spore coat polysaccharide biosynthesis protein SpsF